MHRGLYDSARSQTMKLEFCTFLTEDPETVNLVIRDSKIEGPSF